MTTEPQPGPEEELGPVDFLAIEFPGGRLTAAGFERLLSLVGQGVIGILDMEFITKDADGKSKKIDAWEFAVPDGVDLSAWAGASSGLLDESDVDEISAAMRPGGVAVVVIYENRWVLGLVDEWRRGGARLIANGGLSATTSSPPLMRPNPLNADYKEDTVGLLKTAATVAVASSVHGRIQGRQQARWAAQDQPPAGAPAPPQEYAAPPPPVPPQAPAAPAPSADMGDRLAQLKQLGELLSAGVLTQAEFEQQKARILQG